MRRQRPTRGVPTTAGRAARSAAGALTALTVAGALTACAGPAPGGGTVTAPCSASVGTGAGDDAGPDALLAALDLVRDDLDEVAGVSGSWIDEAAGRVVFDVASGDDGGAASCTALASILDRAGVPYAFEVFEGPVDGTQRTTVGFDEAWTDDGGGLFVNAWSCNGEPELTVLEESADEVRLEITATVPSPGWGGDACLDTVPVPLEEPLTDRTLTDLTRGATVHVEHRRHG